ncbi:MAG: hypothetical protein Q9166_007453 [cf. Caloplaca sp. 2 TL-2023]
MSASQPTEQPLTELSQLSFAVEGSSDKVEVIILDILSYLRSSDGRFDFMSQTLRDETVARCDAQFHGNPYEIVNIRRFETIRIQLWALGGRSSNHKEYITRWNGPAEAAIKARAKEEHDRLLGEWYEARIKACTVETIRTRKEILGTIAMAKLWLNADFKAIATTLNYMCGIGYDHGGFDFKIEEDFTHEEVRLLYEYHQSLEPEDFAWWYRHSPSRDPDVEKDPQGELNQRLREMPWLNEYACTKYNTFFKGYTDTYKAGGYKLLGQWIESAKDWQDQPRA